MKRSNLTKAVLAMAAFSISLIGNGQVKVDPITMY